MAYQCLVCGYRAMPYPAVPYNICPCCGTEFGVDDRSIDYPTLRHDWIVEGMPWFDDITFPPRDWSPTVQLITAGFASSLVMPTGQGTVSERETVCITTRLGWSPEELNSPMVTMA